nr:CinA family protein [Actinomycetales bacterium]
MSGNPEEERVPSHVVEETREAAERVVRALSALDDDAPGGVEPREGEPARSGSYFSFATAESLTSGLLSAVLAEVPGVSQWFLGGVVAYSYDAKERLLGVDRDALERDGAVTEMVVHAMARGVAERLEARWGVATTGVAGPGPAEGEPEGTVWIAVVDRDSSDVTCRLLRSPGGRDEVRWRAALTGLNLLAEVVEQNRMPSR